jgi:hypothetical protein
MFKNNSNIKPSLGSTININHPLAQGLVGCWLFNEQTGNKIYDLNKDNHGSLINGPIWNSSDNGYLQFDGTNDHIVATLDESMKESSLTWIVWYKSLSDTAQTLISKTSLATNTSFDLSVGPATITLTNELITIIGIDSGNRVGYVTSNRNELFDDKWHQIVFIAKPSNYFLYLDGKRLTLTTGLGSNNGNVSNVADSLIIGAWKRQGTIGTPVNGNISQVSIYNRALSSEEVLSLYEQPYQFIDSPAALKYYSYSQHRSLAASSIKSEELLKITHNLNNPRTNTNNIVGLTRRAKDYTINTAIPTADYIALAKPSSISIDNIGTSGSTTYSYRVSAYDKDGNETDTAIITTNTGNTSLSSNNFNRINWSFVDESFGYKIYGRTLGNEQLLSIVRNTYFDDIGSITPSGSYPTTNTTGYNPNKINLGKYFYIGSDSNLTYIKAHDLETIKPLQDVSGTNKYITVADIVKWNDEINWFFGIRHDTAPRTIGFYSHNKKTNKKTYIGDLTITAPDSDSRTMRDFTVSLHRYNAGYASLSGTSVTGINTAWLQSRFAAGSRIGFGSKNPEFVQRWLEISSINSDTSISLLSNFFSDSYTNIPYVIEEIRFVIPFYNNTRGYSEIHLFKGINYFDFTQLRAVDKVLADDNRKGYYRLTETTNIFSIGGIALEPQISNTEHNLYVLSYLSSPANTVVIHKYNIRASLTVSNNLSSSAFLFKCGGTFVTGSGMWPKALSYAVPNYHPYKNRPVLIMLNSNAYTFIPVENIYDGNVDIYESPQESLLPITSDGVNRWVDQNYDIAYDSTIDRFLVLWDAHTYGKYPSLGQINQYNFEETKLYISSNYPSLPIMPEGIVEHINFAFGNFRCRTCDGWYYLMRENGSFFNNTIFITPISGHWLYADQTKNFVILPKIKIDKFNTLKKLNIRSVNFYGNERYGVPAEPLRYYIRTRGIDDDAGAWKYVDSHGDISDIINTGELQIKIETHMFALAGLTKKIYGYSLEYDEPSLLPDGVSWNYEDSNTVTGAVGFIQNKLNNSVPSFKISYYRKSDQKLIFTQSTSNSSNGYFQFYDNGWIIGYGPDQIGLRRRFTPSDVLQKNIEYVVIIGLI